MPIYITKGDITKSKVDAIVNAANNSLLGGGGVDGAIHRAAGIELLRECQTLGGCETGDAKITKGYNLPAKRVIHTVGPIWRGGGHGEEELLKSCYTKSIELAKRNNCKSIAFPLISAGVYGYPKVKAFAVAYESIKANIDDDMTAYIVVFDGQRDIVARERLMEVDRYVEYLDEVYAEDMCCRMKLEPVMAYDKSCALPPKGTDDVFKEVQLDESFSQALLRMIDERGLTDAQCYKKANVDRKLFSKIRSDEHYHPSKYTAIAFAIALELSLDEANDLLGKAGYVLSRSSKADIIIEYFISKGIYDVYTINEFLFAYDQKLLGC